MHSADDNQAAALPSETSTHMGGRVRLLTDDPAASDEFAAGAHGNLAIAIASLVATETGGRVIGLEGTWGAGKSTVVGLVRTKLEEDEATRVVVFDAWAHQGDRLRRTFLETLIARLGAEPRPWLTADSAKAHSDQLTGRSSHVETHTSQRLTFEGFVASAAAVCLVIGSALFQHAYAHHSYLWHRVAFVLMLSPFWALGGLFVLKMTGLAAGHWQRKGSAWARMRKLRPFGFFKQDQEIDTTTSTIERGDPTSVEFESLFSKIMGEVMNGERRLLLVLDNLDRVDEGDAKSLLATMQTFTGSGRSEAAWSSRVWTMIPYDAEGLDRLWGQPTLQEDPEAPSSSGAEAEGQVAPSADEKAPPLSSATATAFIDKVFQVRFSVPPMVLSDWREHLLRLLRDALPDVSDDDLRVVLRLRAAYRSAAPHGIVAKEGPTPRQLMQYVNQVGALWRQRSDVPLPHVAYFALLQRDRLKIAEGLRQGSLPLPALSYLVGDTIEADLAALLFGSSRDLAQQFLLSEQIVVALDGGDAAAVTQLRDRSGFAHALDMVDMADQFADGGVGVARWLATLDAGSLLDDDEVQPWCQALSPRLRLMSSWQLSGRESGVGVALALTAIGSDQVALNESLTRVRQGASSGDADGREHVSGIGGLLATLARLGRYSDELRLNVAIPAERFVDSLGVLADLVEDQHVLAALEFSDSTGDAVTDALFQAVFAESPQARRALDVLQLRPSRLNEQLLSAKVFESLVAADPTTQSQAHALFDVLERCGYGGDNQLGAAADNGTLMSVVAVAIANSWPDVAGRVASLHMWVRPAVPVPTTLRGSDTGAQVTRDALASPTGRPDFVAAQTDWLAQHPAEAAPLLFQIRQTSGYEPWVDFQLTSLHSRGDLRLTAEQVLGHLAVAKAALGDAAIVEVFAGLSESDEAARRTIAESSDPVVINIALDACSLDGRSIDPQLFHEAAARIVGAASQQDWASALSVDATGPLLELATRLAATRVRIGFVTAFNTALHDHAKELAASGTGWQPGGDVFKRTVTRLLNADARKTRASTIAAELESVAGTTITQQFLDTYGPFLADEKEFRTHDKIPNVIELLITNGAWPALNWFVEVGKQHPDLFGGKSREGAVGNLKTLVSSRKQELGEETPVAIEALAQMLGVNVVDAPTEEAGGTPPPEEGS